MPHYRRYYQPGGTYFFTVVTYQRRPLFDDPQARAILHNAWEYTCRRFPFETVGICLLPDHIHCIWRLPENDDRFSIRWKEIKWKFTRKYHAEFGYSPANHPSREKRKEAEIWQRRFWEHLIINEKDLNAHLDYIHINPVKHNLVQQVCDWEYSSFFRYMKQGFYDQDWGAAITRPLDKKLEVE